MQKPPKKTRKRSKPEPEESPKSFVEAIFDEVKFFLKLFGFILVVYTFVFGHFKIPSESMQPTLEVGDHLYVSKHPYGYSKHSVPLGLHKLPFLPEGKIFSKVPKRGDIVVFRDPISSKVLIKRAVGLPGDTIKMQNRQLFVNGTRVKQTETDAYHIVVDKGPRSLFQKIRGQKKGHNRWGPKIPTTEYSEQLPGEDMPHKIYDFIGISSPSENVPNPAVTVPSGMLFMMGDNRDNSEDSRFGVGANPIKIDAIGFVPLSHVIGRADRMVFSLKKCPPDPDAHCPKRGFFKPL
jgi:signal peptidase I